MKVRFALWLLIWPVVLGIVLIVAGLLLLGDPEIAGGVLAAAVAALLVGASQYFTGYFVVDESSVFIPLKLGSRRHTFGSARLRCRGNKLVVDRYGDTENLPVYRLNARREDWDRLVAVLEESDGRPFRRSRKDGRPSA